RAHDGQALLVDRGRLAADDREVLGERTDERQRTDRREAAPRAAAAEQAAHDREAAERAVVAEQAADDRQAAEQRADERQALLIRGRRGVLALADQRAGRVRGQGVYAHRRRGEAGDRTGGVGDRVGDV